MARYDLPAMLKFVLSKTSQPSLFYVGHSQGTLIAFAEFSRNKELAKMVKKFFALGPVTTVGHMESPIKYLAYLTPELQVMNSPQWPVFTITVGANPSRDTSCKKSQIYFADQWNNNTKLDIVTRPVHAYRPTRIQQ